MQHIVIIKYAVNMSNKKKEKIMANKNVAHKKLYEWAEEVFLFDEGTKFLHFCKKEGKRLSDLVSQTEFLTLKEKFEA